MRVGRGEGIKEGGKHGEGICLSRDEKEASLIDGGDRYE